MQVNDKKYGIALRVLTKLRKSGFKAYFAGGCVRDKLLGKIPFDYDIATNATPDNIVHLFPKVVLTGAKFGVSLVIEENTKVEVTTFRVEGKYSDGRHPDFVKFTDEENDAKRRDFTINGLFYDVDLNSPYEFKLERVIDYVNGMADLKQGVIRTIGEPRERFEEDYLRLLRAIRFATEIGFNIEDNTFQSIKKLARHISSISGERIRDELKRIITHQRRFDGLQLLHYSNLLEYIIPELKMCENIEQPVEFHPEGNVLYHSFLTVKYLETYEFTTSLAALLHDIGKAVVFELRDRVCFYNHDNLGAILAKNICARLKLSNKEIEKIEWLIKKHLVIKDVTKMRISSLKKLIFHPFSDDLILLFKADKLASDKVLDDYYFLENFKNNLKKEEVKPLPLLRGQDLIEMGLKPGPIFSEILKKVEEQQLEGTIKTKESAIEFVKELIRTQMF